MVQKVVQKSLLHAKPKCRVNKSPAEFQTKRAVPYISDKNKIKDELMEQCLSRNTFSFNKA
jgi:hypothetical protein